MIHPRHFRERVIRPVLAALAQAEPRIDSDAAEALLLGTAVTESGLVYLVQHGGGPALGLYQIEPATHRDLYHSYLRYQPALREAAIRLAAQRDWQKPDDAQLVANLAYATAIARLIYWRRPEALPAAGDTASLGEYWKTHFNTRAGAGRAADFSRKAGKYL